MEHGRHASETAAQAGRVASLSVFFPCYNDGGTIASMVTAACETAATLTDDYEVIVVEDGSRDASREILLRLQAADPEHVRLVLHSTNRGYGGALRSGFAACSKEWIFYTDGDGQYDPREAALLAAEAGPGVDWVQGWKIKRHDPLHRIVIGRVYHWAMKLLFNLRTRDVDCDFRMLRRSVLQSVQLTQNSGVICLELVKKLERSGARCREVGVHHYFRRHGRSQFFNFPRIFRLLRGVGLLWVRLMVCRDYRPQAAASPLAGTQLVGVAEP